MTSRLLCLWFVTKERFLHMVQNVDRFDLFFVYFGQVGKFSKAQNQSSTHDINTPRVRVRT